MSDATSSRGPVRPRRHSPKSRPSALPPGKDSAGLMAWPLRKAYGRDGHGDCSRCRGRCCTYVVLHLDRPRRKVDVDEIRWLLAHENVQVYIDDGDWHAQFYTRCLHLNAGGLCDIYEDRFDVCREHDAETCELSSGASDEITFSTTEQFDRWWKRHKARRRGKRSKKK